MPNHKTCLPLNRYLFGLLISTILSLCFISTSSAGTKDQQYALYVSGKSVVSSPTFSNLDEPLSLRREWHTENKKVLEVGKQISHGYGPGPNTIMCLFFAIAFLILRRKEPAPKRKDDGLSE